MTAGLIVLSPVAAPERARMQDILSEVALEFVETIADLEAVLDRQKRPLLAFGTGVIVPAHVLERLDLPAYNLHAASPDFPGRDPHHHAVFRQASVYGATLHIMTARVDAGPIVGVERFSVPPETRPHELLALANEAAWRLLERIGPGLSKPEPLPALPDEQWGAEKSRRSDLQRLSRVTPLSSPEEVARIERAFNTPDHTNLHMMLHGRVFRHDPAADPPNDPTDWSEFTVEGYRRLLEQLIEGGYRFTSYGDKADDRHVIWRHDVDVSMHRAVRLAELERDLGATAIYFLNPRSPFYSLLEPDIVGCTRAILEAGHTIGLHFDASAFAGQDWDRQRLDKELASEKQLLERITGQEITSVSWHNPDLCNLLSFEDEALCGMHNAYSARMRSAYTYCSDSNGHWRFRPMPDVIADSPPRLHLLTHPVWWTEAPMAPSEKIDLAILGRARRVRAEYDRLVRGDEASPT